MLRYVMLAALLRLSVAVDVSVQIDTSHAISRVIAPNFVSYSLEVSNCVNWFGNDTKQVKKSFVRLMEQNMLTPGQAGPIFRIGGNSADQSIWNPTYGPLPSGDDHSISGNDLVVINNAVQVLRTRAIYGLNFRDAKSAGHAVQHVQAIDQFIGWKSVESLEIGNENDLYDNNGIREKGYDYKQYNDEWTMYAKAIQAALPKQQIRFEGATFATDHWYPNISQYAKQHQDVLSSISVHSYPLTHCKGHNTTIADLMTDSSAQDAAKDIAKHRLVQALDSMNIPLYLGEVNSVSCAGMPGVSNVFASALWVIDYLFNLALVGAQRVNFHGGGGPTSYTTIAWDHSGTEQPTVMPLYYGHHVFAQATRAEAKLLATTFDQSKAPYFKVWACRSRDQLSVVLLHKNETAAPVVASLNLTAPTSNFEWPTGELRFLTAPSLSEMYDVQFGGITWKGSKDGEPIGQEHVDVVQPVISADGNSAVYSVSIDPASGGLLRLKLGTTTQPLLSHRHRVLSRKLRA